METNEKTRITFKNLHYHDGIPPLIGIGLFVLILIVTGWALWSVIHNEKIMRSLTESSYNEKYIEFWTPPAVAVPGDNSVATLDAFGRDLLKLKSVTGYRRHEAVICMKEHQAGGWWWCLLVKKDFDIDNLRTVYQRYWDIVNPVYYEEPYHVAR